MSTDSNNKMELEIYTHDKDLLPNILGKSSPSRSDSVVIDGNAKLTYRGITIRLSDGLPEIINLTLTFWSSVAAGVVANWLYEKFKGRTVKIVINKREINLDKEQIKNIVEETIRIEK